MPNELIRTVGLKKYFKVPAGYLHAVDDINISINKGETLGVVGESGCGKSTLGRTMLRMHEPTAGELYFAGENILKYGKKQMKTMRARMQMIFQDPYSSLNPRMCVEEIISEPMIVHHISKNEVYKRTYELMDIVGLAERYAGAYPHEMDGGRRQRIGIARALSLNPEFIVCDEPVSALDVSIQAQILNLLMDLQRELSLTYLFITHDLSVVKHISNNIAVMYLGQCVEFASSKELFKNPRHPYTKALLAAIPTPSIETGNKRIEVIKGEVTSPINPAPGCRFSARCPYASEACKSKQVLREISKNHKVACHLTDDACN